MKEPLFSWGTRTYVMGIVNVTPDSFSGDGVMTSSGDVVANALAQAQAHVKEGADIIDVGGESTRPGGTPVSLEEELARVIPVIRELSRTINVPISIDTYKAEVARQAVAVGAQIINDVWGLRMDREVAKVAAETGVYLVLMHNRSRPKDAEQENKLGGRYVGVVYENLIEDIKRELMESVSWALRAGVSSDRIIVDPGLGFGKTVEQNLEIINRLDEFRSLGFPLLVGPSRKSFVGYTLNLPMEERLEGTGAAVALTIDRGADIVRVHDVEQMVRVARFSDAVTRSPRAPS